MKAKTAPPKGRSRAVATKKGARAKTSAVRLVAKEFARARLQRTSAVGAPKRRPRITRTILLDTKAERAPVAVFQAPPQAALSHVGARVVKGLGEV